MVTRILFVALWLAPAIANAETPIFTKFFVDLIQEKQIKSIEGFIDELPPNWRSNWVAVASPTGNRILLGPLAARFTLSFPTEGSSLVEIRELVPKTGKQVHSKIEFQNGQVQKAIDIGDKPILDPRDYVEGVSEDTLNAFSSSPRLQLLIKNDEMTKALAKRDLMTLKRMWKERAADMHEALAESIASSGPRGE